MFLFRRFFGSRSSGGRERTPEKAIQRLRETEKMLAEKQELLQKKVEQELLTAKKNCKKNKRVALQSIRRKQCYEKQLGQIDGTLWSLELQREELENADITPQVIKNMGVAAQAMKAAHKNMNIDKVYDLMAEITEQQEMTQEISDVISRPISFGEEYDEISIADVQGSDADVTELQKKLNDALEKNKQLLEKDRQREDSMRELVDRMLWLEKELTDGNWTDSQPHISKCSDETREMTNGTENNEGPLQRDSEVEKIKQVNMTLCKDKEEAEELEQQLKGEGEDLQAQLTEEKNRSAVLELQLRLLQKFMVNHHEKIQEKIGALEREVKITSQDLQDEKENCSYLKKQLFKALKDRRLDPVTRKTIRITLH